MTRTTSQLCTRLARFYRDKSGAVLIYSAFMIPVILGVSGLSVDVGSWYANKRVAQAAADAGAIGAALEILRVNQNDDGGDVTESEIQAIAIQIASLNGYDDDAGDEIEVNYPPKYGPYAGAGDSVEVIVRRPASVFLA
ncbi:MAG: pilus assembly protein TadG-related protein, partial [Kiloniellales bacterium]